MQESGPVETVGTLDDRKLSKGCLLQVCVPALGSERGQFK